MATEVKDEVTPEQKKGVRRTAIILVGVALTFYIGFILIGVFNH